MSGMHWADWLFLLWMTAMIVGAPAVLVASRRGRTNPTDAYPPAGSPTPRQATDDTPEEARSIVRDRV